MGLTVFVRPENLAPLLPAPLDLTWAEKVVLTVTCGLKGFTRLETAREETGIESVDYELAKTSLVNRGLLNRAGAITLDGRNAANALPGGYDKLSFLNREENGGKEIKRWGGI